MMALLKPFKRELAIVAALSLITNLMALVPTIYMLQPVSYTHLDVYKRQLQGTSRKANMPLPVIN